MTYTLVLTSVAHIVNITVTRRLISQGINVPDYFKIGCWPSVEMVIDYLAGILCLFGFYGALFINENLWYMAPLAYGIMQIYICIKAGKIE